MLFINKISKLNQVANKLSKIKDFDKEIGFNFSKENIEIEYLMSFYILNMIEKDINKKDINNVDFLLLWGKYLSIYLNEKKKIIESNEEKRIETTINEIIKLNPDKTINQIIKNEKKLTKDLKTINSKIEIESEKEILKNIFNKLDIIVFNLDNIIEKELYNYNKIDSLRYTKEFYNYLKQNNFKESFKDKPFQYETIEKIKKDFFKEIYINYKDISFKA